MANPNQRSRVASSDDYWDEFGEAVERDAVSQAASKGIHDLVAAGRRGDARALQTLQQYRFFTGGLAEIGIGLGWDAMTGDLAELDRALSQGIVDYVVSSGIDKGTGAALAEAQEAVNARRAFIEGRRKRLAPPIAGGTRSQRRARRQVRARGLDQYRRGTRSVGALSKILKAGVRVNPAARFLLSAAVNTALGDRGKTPVSAVAFDAARAVRFYRDFVYQKEAPHDAYGLWRLPNPENTTRGLATGLEWLGMSVDQQWTRGLNALASDDESHDPYGLWRLPELPSLGAAGNGISAAGGGLADLASGAWQGLTSSGGPTAGHSPETASYEPSGEPHPHFSKPGTKLLATGRRASSGRPARPTFRPGDPPLGAPVRTGAAAGPSQTWQRASAVFGAPPLAPLIARPQARTAPRSAKAEKRVLYDPPPKTMAAWNQYHHGIDRRKANRS